MDSVFRFRRAVDPDALRIPLDDRHVYVDRLLAETHTGETETNRLRKIIHIAKKPPVKFISMNLTGGFFSIIVCQKILVNRLVIQTDRNRRIIISQKSGQFR